MKICAAGLESEPGDAGDGIGVVTAYNPIHLLGDCIRYGMQCQGYFLDALPIAYGVSWL
jgi:hypothetical protein